MPQYLFENPKTGEVKEVIQTMSEPHVYSEDGIEWARVWTVPQGAIDVKIDPFNQRQFMDKTGANKGKLGEVWDRSAEMSERRADQAGGIDPVKEKYYKNYSAKRQGKPHPREIREKMEKLQIRI